MATVFYSGKMVSDQLDAALTNGRAQEDLKDGYLVELGDLVADVTYDANGLEYDVYEAAAPTAATSEVGIIDYAGISQGEIIDNVYKMGHKLYNLTIPAGENFRVRRVHLHDKFWLGADCFKSAPTVGEFATAEADEFTHKPAATLPQAGYAVKVLVEKDLTTGMRNNGKLYLCEVVQL